MKKSSARRRYAAFVVVILVSTGVVSFYSGTLIRTLSFSQEETALTEMANIVRNALLRAQPDDVDAFVKSVGTGNVRITVINRTGEVVGDSRADIVALENHATRPEIRDAYYGKVGVAVRRSASIGTELLYLALPVFELNDERVVVRTSTAMENIASELRRNYALVGLGGLIVFLVVAGITLSVERRMIEPIAALQEAASEFASGNLNHYLRVEYPPDLKTVAKSMNVMAHSLKTRIEDVTRQKDEIATILANMEEGVIVFKRDLSLYTVNAAARRLAPDPAADPTGESILGYFRNSSITECAESVFAQAEPVEEIVQLPGGENELVQVRGGVLPDGSLGTIVLHDITRLLKLEKVRKDFVANVSHELKTPVTAVKGYLETLIETHAENRKTTREFLKKALHNTDRLIVIIEDLLQLSRIEEKPDELARFEDTLLLSLAETAVQTAASSAKKRGVRIEVNANADVHAAVNPILLEHALFNLIDNAVKYSESGSAVMVSFKDKKTRVGVQVEDSGRGIPAKDLPRIFERFYRVDKARSSDLGGTGLGLSIVKHVAAIHSGTAEAESVEGKGSTFTIWIPKDLSGDPDTDDTKDHLP